MKKIYMDHAATTPVDKRVFEVMRPFFSDKFGNASSIHAIGQEASDALEKSRKKLASVLNADPAEIIFTSGGTESNNFALKGTAFANRKKGKHIITTKIEHDCVLNSAKWLERQGFDVTYLPVDRHGLVDLNELEKSIRKDTILISVMHANNEIGTIEPIEDIAKIASERSIYFHTDAVQTTGKLKIDVKKLSVDMLSISSHKLFGPKGVGALFVRSGTKIDALLHGGGHERGMRSGTENVAGIVGFAEAVKIADKEREREMPRIAKMRDKLIKEILDEIPNSYLTGHPKKRLPINASFYFKFIEGESLILKLDDKGIEASTGSACSSKSLKPSHVLLATGLKPEDAHGSLRLTLGKDNTTEEIDYVIKSVSEVVEELRKISPFKKSFEKV
ncbi:MAG: cysteine desulfurase NifS [Candidatus Aenigmarchaeota archaeon ex4484_14]|nr:MAG: cysteine desulfurase NifS [Candidatus Aenigmarchaeota archaeon ex4484_14]